MSRCRFNWQNIDSFEWKFKRMPKLRTISEVHDLYLSAMERSLKKSKEVMDCINEIVREIPPTSASNSRYNDSYITYFYSNDILYQYSTHLIGIGKHQPLNYPAPFVIVLNFRNQR